MLLSSGFGRIQRIPGKYDIFYNGFPIPVASHCLLMSTGDLIKKLKTIQTMIFPLLCKTAAYLITHFPLFYSRTVHWLRCVWTQRALLDTLQWRHNERDGVLNYRRFDSLLNRLFRSWSKETSTLCVTGLCAGNTPVTGEFPAQKASNAENVSIWWRHRVHYNC